MKIISSRLTRRDSWSAAIASVAAFLLWAGPLVAFEGAQPTVDAIEARYADFLDAHGALEAINAGALPEVDGHDRTWWDERRSQLERELSLIFNNLKYNSHVEYSDRVVASMRRGFEDMTSEGDSSSALSGNCADARSTGADRGKLSAALYACFDSIGNQLTFEGVTLTRVGALQLLQEVPEPARRRALFMALEPLWRAINAGNEMQSPYRRLIRSQAPEYAKARSPVHEAAAAFDIPTAEAERWLVNILSAWEASIGDAGLIEPWDFRYRYSAASRALAAMIPRESLLPLQQRFYADLGADPATLGVLFDLEPRPGKAPLAYADTVRIGRSIGGVWRPAIARVSANDDRGGLGILNELVHETGHAVHFLAIRARPAFFWPDTTFIEAFADVTSWAVFTPQWQQRYLGHSVSRAEGLREQYAGVMLDVAWSLFELRMLQRPGLDPNALWTDITQRYLHIAPHPEMSWWAIRSQLVTDPGYMIHYGLGAVITAQIRARTRAAIGSFDAGNPRWYAWTSSHLLADGGRQPMSLQLRQFLGHPPTPDALIEDIRSIARPVR